MNVVVFIFLTVFVFSIVGQTLFTGEMDYACRSTATPMLGERSWQKVEGSQ